MRRGVGLCTMCRQQVPERAAARRLNDLFSGLELVNTKDVHATCEGVDSLSGECTINTRKAKLIPSYELLLRVSVSGDVSGTPVRCTVSFPYIADECHDEDPSFTVEVAGTSPAETAMKMEVTQSGKGALCKAIAQWVADIHRGGPYADGAKGGEQAEARGDGANRDASRPAPDVAPASAAKQGGSDAKAAARCEGLGTISIQDQFLCRPDDVFEALMDARRVMAYTQSPASIEASASADCGYGVHEGGAPRLGPSVALLSGQRWRHEGD